MVWKSLIRVLCLVCALAAILAMPVAASAAGIDYELLESSYLDGRILYALSGLSDYYVKAYPVAAGEIYRLYGTDVSLRVSSTLVLFSEDLTYGAVGVSDTDQIILTYEGTVIEEYDTTYISAHDGYILVACVAGLNEINVELVVETTPYSVYDGNISSTYLTIFEDIVGKTSIFDDYVFFRNSQYEYVLLSGNITYSGGIFSVDTATEYRIHTNTAYNSSYVYTQAEVKAIEVSPGNYLVYSNLGNFPDLVDRGDFYAFALLVLGLICVFMFLIRSIFSWTYRGAR